MAVLEVSHMYKHFNGTQAVDDVSFVVNSGYIYGLLGPNGAGKTTTIRMIMNIILPDSGSIVLFGEAMSNRLKSKIGYLPEERGLYPKMKVLDLLTFMGELRGLPATQAKEKSLSWLKKMDLSGRAQNKVEELSKGMQQKLQIISTIIHEPDLIILDEPFSGLDPVNVNLIKNIMLELKEQNKTIILSTHMMETAEKLCDEVLMISKGRKVLDGELKKIQAEYGKNSIHLEFEGDGRFIASLPMVKKCDFYSNYVEIELHDSSDSNDLLRHILDKIKITEMHSQKSSLNKIFITLAGGGNEQ